MKFLRQIDLEDIVFLDIETVRIVDKLEKDTPLWDSWDYKLRYSREAEKFDGSIEDQFEQKAALYAEFAKVVCITIGKVKGDKIVLKSYSGEDEKAILTEFCETLEGLISKNKRTRLAGHAIIGFDLPFLMRRCLVNGVELPALIDLADEKPWTITAIDTLNLWKGTGFYGASLINIATAFGLPSPKSDINGSETSDVYYKEGLEGIQRITRYCERDVATVGNIILRMRGDKALESEVSQVNTEKAPLLEKIYNTKKVTSKDRTQLNNFLSDLDEDEQKDAKLILDVTLPKS